MASILEDIIRHKARKLAQRHVKQAVFELTHGGDFDFASFEQDIRNSYWKRKSFDFIFEKAYDGPWYALGAEDAIKGRRRFDVPAYLQGWRSQILSMAYNGWVNPRVVEQYGWIDEVIGQQYMNAKHQIDQLDWASTPLDKKDRKN